MPTELVREVEKLVPKTLRFRRVDCMQKEERKWNQANMIMSVNKRVIFCN